MSRYKLINNKTKEEHICSKVVIDGFDYYIDKDKKTGDYFVYDNSHNSPGFIVMSIQAKERIVYREPHETDEDYGGKDGGITPLDKDINLIIACDNPNLYIPQVINEGRILADSIYEVELDDYDGRVEEYDFNEPIRNAYVDGFSKAKELYPFSIEDMIEFAQWCHKPSLDDVRQCNVVYIPSGDFYWYRHKKYTPEELINIWQEQKIQIIYYE